MHAKAQYCPESIVWRRRGRSPPKIFVLAGLDPAIHALWRWKQDVDARIKSAQDDLKSRFIEVQRGRPVQKQASSTPPVRGATTLADLRNVVLVAPFIG